MISKRRADDVHDNENLKKMPRLLEPEEELQLSRLGEASYINDQTVIIQCNQWRWTCNRNALSSRCSFFKACLENGFKESTSGVIMLSEDPPLAVQAMLRYLSGNSLSEIYRPSEPIFSDVERDLDVFAIADKYDLQKLRTYMNSRLVHFYSTDQRPPRDPKGWSAKNQDGFASVLRKLSKLEMDCREIQLAIAGFLIRRSNMVMKWEGVREAIEDNPQFLKVVFLASLQRTKELEATVQNLEERLEDLEEYSSCLEEERDDLVAREEDMAAFFDSAFTAYHGPLSPEYGDWAECYHSGYYDYGGHEEVFEMEGIPSPPTPSTPLFVEDILSGISFVLTPDGPEPVNRE